MSSSHSYYLTALCVQLFFYCMPNIGYKNCFQKLSDAKNDGINIFLQREFSFALPSSWEQWHSGITINQLPVLGELVLGFIPYISEVAQSCLTLCDPVDCSPPDSSIHGIFQARILEWVAISFSRGSSRPRDQTQVSRIAGRRFNL